MSLVIQIKEDLKEALRARQDLKLTVLRQTCAALKNEAINLKKGESDLSDEEAFKVLKKESKKRKDSIESFKLGGRQELAEKEAQELEILKIYLPQDLSESDINKVIDEVIKQAGETAPQLFGKLMKEVMTRLSGQADGGVVSQLLKDRLNS